MMDDDADAISLDGEMAGVEDDEIDLAAAMEQGMRGDDLDPEVLAALL